MNQKNCKAVRKLVGKQSNNISLDFISKNRDMILTTSISIFSSEKLFKRLGIALKIIGGRRLLDRKAMKALQRDKKKDTI